MKAYAKLNIFLKIKGKIGSYHDLCSRFVLFHALYDELSLCDKKSKKSFELLSNIDFKDNIIYLIYNKLCKMGYEKALLDFFKDKALYLQKNIPHGAGLGGGSSDGACFLQLINKELKLDLDFKKQLLIADGISADMPFFLSKFSCANVFGKGDIIEAFEDDDSRVYLENPGIFCSTAKVFEEFAKSPCKSDETLNKHLLSLKTSELLEYENILLNDLYAPCIRLYPGLRAYKDSGAFLSGSGSFVFRKVNENNS